MIIIRSQIKLLLFTLVFSGCSAQKKDLNDCVKANVESETFYSGNNKTISQNMNDFNSMNSKSLDIVRILVDSGYETVENFKRVYIQEDKLYVIDNGVEKELSDEEMKRISKVFINPAEFRTLINCKINSSRRYTYRYFVRINNKLVMSFVANNLPRAIDKDLVKEEIKFINLFEDLQ